MIGNTMNSLLDTNKQKKRNKKFILSVIDLMVDSLSYTTLKSRGNWKNDLGTKITVLRNKKGYSQSALAEKVNVDRSYISKIERGIIPIRNKKIISDIAHTLRVPTNTLYKGRLSECFELQR